jgi:hypothetical protein
MDTDKNRLVALRQEIIAMLMTITDETLLLQLKDMMLAAGVEPDDEIRTLADLEARFRKVEQDYAEGRYITHEELLAEIETWR